MAFDEYGVPDKPEPPEAAYLGTSTPLKIGSHQEAEALAPGTEFVGPDGKTHIKPYQVKVPADIGKVPEGSYFVGPDGKTRQRPAYEGMPDLDTQFMIDLARGNEKQIEAILKGQIKGGEVKREPGTNEMYVEKDGKLYKPGRGSVGQRTLANVQAQAMPMILGTAGMLTGGLPGAALGGAGGEAYNQMLLTLSGYPAPLTENLKGMGLEGAMSAAGGAAGGIVGKGVEKAVGAGQFGKDALRLGMGGKWLAKILGAQPEETAQAARLTTEGVRVPPSHYLKEAPYLQKVEQFDKAFRKQDVFGQSAKEHYDTEVPRVLEAMGLKPGATPPTEATAPVALEPFGAHMLAQAQTRLADKDRALDAAIQAARAQIVQRAGVQGDPKAREATINALVAAELEARKAAQNVVDNGFRSIEADVANSIKLAGASENPGDMVRLADEKIRGLRRSVAARAEKLYGAADAAAGDAKPDVSGLAGEAKEFMDQVPKEFKDRYPAIVRSIADMKSGATFGQLHQLRSMLRQDIDYNDLTPGVRSGALKNFVNKINDVLFDQEAAPSLKEAAQLLKGADEFYAKNISKFKAQSVKWIAQQLEAGVPADAETLARTIFQPGQSEEIASVRKIVGKPLWSAVQAADTKTMLNQSKTLVPGEIDGMRFAEQVLQRDRDGILGAAYDSKTAAALREQAQRVLMMKGKIPIEAKEGDTLATLIRRADSIAAEIKAEAESDPVKMLAREMKDFERNAAKMKGKELAQLKAGPLSFLHDPTAGALQAAESILRKPDRIIAVATQFGEQSPEFEMLRQVWAERLFQRSAGSTGKLAGEFAEKISPEVQSLMFPGLSLKAAQTLARDMNFLLPGGEMDTGASMAAASRVLHPLSGSKNILARAAGHLPGANAIGRIYLGNYYKLLMYSMTRPAFVRYIAAGLDSGNDAMRDLARREFMKSYGEWVRKVGGGIGAANVETVRSTDEGFANIVSPPHNQPLTQTPVKPWREVYKEKFGANP